MADQIDGARRGHPFRRGKKTFGSLVGVLLAVAVAALSIFFIFSTRGLARLSKEGRDLQNAKTIYLGLKMYASDHLGKFPDKPPGGVGSLTDSNQAYRNLVPDYLPSERVFYLEGSAWTPSEPDEKTGAKETLAAGENHYAYVPNLTDTANPGFPLIADGFAEGKPGTYADLPSKKGGVWKGKFAIVVRTDGSGRMEKVDPTDFHVYGPTESGRTADVFAPSTGWLAPGQIPLNPASR